jgi:hypothetical protein
MGVLAQRMFARHGRTTSSSVAYRDIRIPATPTLVTQTFRISGVDENGSKFDLNAVDLYTVSAGKISSKSSYWKRIQ